VRGTLSGVIPVMGVPFTRDERVDEEGFCRWLDAVLRAQVDGVMLFGLASEFYKLTDAERLTLRTRFLEQTSQAHVPAIVSVASHATVTAAREAREAAEAGANLVNLFLPSFLKPSRSALHAHIGAVARAAPVPLIVQYAPREAGADLDPSFFAALAEECPNIVAVKVESQPPGPYVDALRRAAPRLGALVGYAGINLEDAVRRGAAGVQPGSSFVEVYQALWRGYQSANPSGPALYRTILPYLALWMQHPEYIIAVEKEIARRRGFITDACCRRPAYTLDREDQRVIDEFMEVAAAHLS
jgi:dihydrodipicolinate synthase/N-acetylneuraminate lyase